MSCGNLTAGGVSAEATVVVSGDAESGPSPAPFRSPVATQAGDEDDEDDEGDDADEAEGEIEAELQLFLVAADGSEVPLSDGPLQVEVDVQGREDMVVARRSVPARAYTALRVVFTELEIEIDSGLVVNGVPVIGGVEVELDDETLVVQRPLNLLLGEGEAVELLVDLNAKSWLLSVDPVLHTVAEGIVANAITVTRRR